MHPAAFDEENVVLDVPPGMSAAQCEVLSAFRGFSDGGHPILVSCWRPTAEEMEEIRRTGRVWLVVLGHATPPVTLRGFSPFAHGIPGHGGDPEASPTT